MRVRLLVALALTGCLTRQPTAELPPPPREPGFLLRQELRFSYGSDSGSLEAVVHHYDKVRSLNLDRAQPLDVRHAIHTFYSVDRTGEFDDVG